MTTARTQTSGGFTLVELIMAMAVFGFLLLIAAGGFLNVVRIHRSAAAARSTQQNSRALVEEMVRTIRSSKLAIVNGNVATGYSLCLSTGTASTDPMTVFYLVQKAGGRTVYDSDLHEARIVGPACPTAAITCPSGTPCDRALNSSDTAVVEFIPRIIAAATNITPASVQVEVRLASDTSLLNTVASPPPPPGTPPVCNPAQTGGEFCSVTVLQSAASLEGQ